MKHRSAAGLRPQKVIAGKAAQFGNRGIKKQQGTTRILYDSLPTDGRQVYRFFEGANNREFPFSNVGSRGELQVGETIILERAYLGIFSFALGTTDIVGARNLALATDPIFAKAEFSFTIAENRVIKRIPVLSWFPEFNKNAAHPAYNNFEFDTQVVIQPLLEFVAEVRSQGVTTEDTQLQMTIEGVGSILAPKKPF